MNKELEAFLGDLPTVDKKVTDPFADLTSKPAEIVPEKDAKVEPDLDGEGRKNRRHRRLEDQLRAERESNIALNERVKALSEVRQFQRETGASDQLDPELLEVFGNNDVGKRLARIFEGKLQKAETTAEQRALEKFEQIQADAAKEEAKLESMIDSELEALEDKYDVDLTSDSPAARKTRREFLDLVEKFSPKNEAGYVSQYADFESTFEEYQSRQPKANATRQKEISSRTMEKSGTVDTAKTEDDATKAWLRANGIRV